MGYEIQQRFSVAVPVEKVWAFLLDPARVVTCMPGAQLERAVDERTFLGNLQVKIGAITTRYQGRVRFLELDETQHLVRVQAEGRETGGGTARGTLTSRLRALPDGGTEVVAEASVELTGRIVQMGRGMIQGVSDQLFAQFAARARQHLEGSHEVGGRPALAPNAPIAILPLLWQSLWSALVRLLRRVFARPAP